MPPSHSNPQFQQASGRKRSPVATEIGCNINYLEKEQKKLLNIATKLSMITASVVIYFNEIFISYLYPWIFLIYLESYKNGIIQHVTEHF
jgi:hypothetical protein